MRIGVRICISCKPSQPVNFGRRFVTSSCIVQTTSSAYARRMKKKSVPVSFSTGSCPSLILWAFMMIALSCACRNTSPPQKGKREFTFRQTTFREGDKVMQIKNNYNVVWRCVDKLGRRTDEGTGVFNGASPV